MSGMFSGQGQLSVGQASASLDPQDWGELRSQAHVMLDDMIDYLAQLRARPVWQPIPNGARAKFREPLPRQGGDLKKLHRRFMGEILPFAVGNAHPGFMGWVHGGGSAAGMLAEMLAAGLNANLGGRDQMPIEVEKQILHWVRDLFGFPDSASGLFVTGASMANFIAVLVARRRALGADVRTRGVISGLVGYASADAHGCIARAFDMAGLGSDNLRRIPVDAGRRIRADLLVEAIVADRAAGLTPFFIAGTAGSVDCGAIDDLHALADIALRKNCWFHVDGAFGALLALSPKLAPRLDGIERADSIAFDFHKWGQVPYDAGYVLVRDADLHQATFASPAAYLSRETRGMAAGSPWPCDFGPDLSRGFRALKVWFTLQAYGADRLAAAIEQNCALAALLKAQVEAEPELELMAPADLNIVCFRYRCDDADRINAAIVADVQEGGFAAPSATRIDGRFAIRAAIVNHRTEARDISALIGAVLAAGRRHAQQETRA